MTETVRSHALEPFFTTRRDAGGSGLGLATVYGIVTGAGGAITIESVPGEGTTVVLYLPTTSESVRDSARRAAAPAQQDDRTVVLVAEDEPTILALTTRCWPPGIHGADRRVRRRGAQARPRHETDRRAPDGRDHARNDGQRAGGDAHHERPGLPIVFMSGYSDQIVADGVLDADTLYLSKPFRPQELLDLLALALAVAPPSRPCASGRR